jgi:FixJ family two-component response regulator
VQPLVTIIDDDKPLGDALRRMLTSYGFTAVSFVSAREFLQADEQHQTGCIILDVRMPEMSGIALHEHLISEGRYIPTIIMTACPSAGERSRVLASGAVSYLAKPLSEDVLLESVRDALQQHNAGECSNTCGHPDTGN